MPVPLSVIVPTGNREDTIEDCLKSVRWAGEILVVDSISTDGTLQIAEKYADRILRHEYINSALQKNWAIPQATHEWVFIVDTDERVPAGLRNEIMALLNTHPPEAGFRIPRINYLLGREMLHMDYYPDYQIRLFRKEKGKYEPRNVHAHVLVEGLVGTLENPLVHYAHRSVEQTLENLLVLMTRWEAEQRSRESAARGVSPTRGLWAKLIFRPIAAFGLRYFRQGGWREGTYGLVMSIIWAMYVSITYMRLWEEGLKLPDNWWQIHWEKNWSMAESQRNTGGDRN